MRWGVFALSPLLLLNSFAAGASSDAAKPLMRDFMGINGHTVQFKPGLYSPTGGLVRDYHPVEWDLGKETEKLPAFPEAKNRVNWESVYGSWKKEGYRVDVCLMIDAMPRPSWKNLEADARAYGESFARNFGPSSSQKLVESVEIGNEPGAWSDRDYRDAFKAIAEGLRVGDPKLRIATAAVTTVESHAYAKSVQCLEGLDSSYDVLTLHTYAQLEGWPTWKRSFPEDRNLKDYLPDVEKLCLWRDKHAPGKAVWITEFGYDSSTQTPSKENEFKKWQGCSDLQQAQWLVRSYLLFSTMEVERAYLYFFDDKDEPQLHGSAGLTRNFVPKPSYYAVGHLYRTLGDYRFNRTIKNETDLRVQEYRKGDDPTKIIWVAWSPSGSGQEKRMLLGDLPGRIRSVERMPLQQGKVEAVDFPGELLISESPSYIFFDALP